MIRVLMVCSMGLVLLLAGCSAPSKAPDLGGIYNHLAQHEDPYRNPVILIPGLLGSKLVDPDREIMVWGAFGTGTLNPNKPYDARLFGLPMKTGKNLYELTDRVKPAGTLDRVVVNFGGYPIEQNVYAYILGVLGVGGYRDEQHHDAGQVDWGNDLFTCFQFAHDPALWIEQRWGLADPDQGRVLRMLLPDAADDAQRRQIALDHLEKCLRRARQFADAMDRFAQTPIGLQYYLVVGDAEDTPKTARINAHDPAAGEA